MRYRVNIQRSEEGFSVRVPGLPGCWSQGQTEEEALENVRDAIETYLATVEELSKDKESRRRRGELSSLAQCPRRNFMTSWRVMPLSLEIL